MKIKLNKLVDSITKQPIIIELSDDTDMEQLEKFREKAREAGLREREELLGHKTK